ncbi:MAG: hypothetical protein Q4D44_07030 [Eubacteriales bacterium]|nr:hypothetical protein [Eubacteriales bacterium]
MKKRTIRNLRESLEGKIYVYLGSEEICRKFYKDAEGEGFMFGADVSPLMSPYNDVISLENHCLSHAGFAGHLGFHHPEAVVGGCHRIDYEKYIRGDSDYFYTD